MQAYLFCYKRTTQETFDYKFFLPWVDSQVRSKNLNIILLPSFSFLQEAIIKTLDVRYTY